MSDDVIDLNQKRIERDHEAGHALHDAGGAFAFMPWEFQDEIGYIEGAHPLCILFEPENLRGICMTKESAEKLVAALQDALASPHAPWNGGTLEDEAP